MNEVYLQNINLKEMNPRLISLRSYALLHKVPIITYEGIRFLNQIITLKKAKRVLEIGTAIGYSSIAMALANDVNIVTIERDEKMFELAQSNIRDANVENRITTIYGDALDVDEKELGTFDIIFIDAAKAQSIKFFEKFEHCLTSDGVIITDNLLFHGLVHEEVRDRNLKQLVRKIDRFNQYVVNRDDYNTFIYNIGDGMSLSIRKV